MGRRNGIGAGKGNGEVFKSPVGVYPTHSLFFYVCDGAAGGLFRYDFDAGGGKIKDNG